MRGCEPALHFLGTSLLSSTSSATSGSFTMVSTSGGRGVEASTGYAYHPLVSFLSPSAKLFE